MAQSRSKRRRKHRGTQAGTIETPAHRSAKSSKTGSNSSRARTPRQVKEPTWRSAAYKAAAAALVFGLLSATLLHQNGGAPAIVVTVVFVFFLYLPIAFWTDRAVYKRRQAKTQAGK